MGIFSVPIEGAWDAFRVSGLFVPSNRGLAHYLTDRGFGGTDSIGGLSGSDSAEYCGQ